MLISGITVHIYQRRWWLASLSAFLYYVSGSATTLHTPSLRKYWGAKS